MSRRVSPVAVTLTAVALGLAGNLTTNTVKIPDRWAPAVWVMTGALTGVAVLIKVLCSRGEGTGSADALTVAAAGLAMAVRRQWQEEVARRALNDPYPLPVRWVAAEADLVAPWADLERLATDGVGWPRADRSGWAGSAQELAGADGDLAAVWSKVPTGRLVVLGEPGAGKSMLLARLVLDLLAADGRPARAPVPVLVSVASWDPASEDLYTWLGRRLGVDYPALDRPIAGTRRGGRPVTLARGLMTHGLIMMVLDGLDEIPTERRAAAVAGINQVLEPGQPIIVSCRTSAYRDATRAGASGEVTLTGAAGIVLCPVQTTEVITYLRRSAGGPAGHRRWDQVAAALQGQQAPALTEALRTPLMAMLARTIYNPRAGEPTTALPDPAHLLALPTRRAVEQHLFDGFIPAAYRPHPTRRTRWRPDQARRWLGYLASHLEGPQDGAPDLAWWQLHRRPRHSPARAVTVAVGGVVAMAAGTAAALLYTIAVGPHTGVGIGAVVGATTAVVFGITQRLTGRLDAAATAAVMTGLAGGLAGNLTNDIGAGSSYLVVVPTVGLATGLAYPLRPSATRNLKVALWAAIAIWLETWLTVGLTLGLTGALAVGLAVGLPVGLTAGLTAGLLVGLGIRLTTAHADPPSAPSNRWFHRPLPAALATALTVGLMYGLTTGLRYGLTAGLTAGLLVGVGIRLTTAHADPLSATSGGWVAKPVVAGFGCGLLVTSFLYSADIGLAVGLVAGLGVELASRLMTTRLPAHSLRWNRTGLLAGVLTGAATTVYAFDRHDLPGTAVIGLTVGCAVAVAYGVDAPTRVTEIRSPQQVLTRDRTIFVVIAATVAAAVTVASGLAVNHGKGFNVSAALASGLTYALAVGFTVAASRTAWPHLAVTRCRLAAGSHTPWRLMTFLSDAHLVHGVLRQNGATYQFRHIDLQRRLAATYSATASTSDDTGTSPKPTATQPPRQPTALGGGPQSRSVR